MVYLIWPAVTHGLGSEKKAVTAPPLGLASLAAWLEQAGEKVLIHDLALSGDSYAQLSDSLRQVNPDVIGISCPMSHLETEILVLAPLIRNACPDAKILIGGNHATFRASEILAKCDAIDAVVLYDGEETLLGVARMDEVGADWPTIAGLVYRSSSGIKKSAQRPRATDLDQLPKPARHLLHMDKYPEEYRGQLITSRGCPYGCAFCATSAFHGRSVRYRSVSHLMEEIDDMILNHGVNALAFVDDTFTVNRGRTLELCTEIRNTYPKMKWTCESRFETLDEELLLYMSNSGCTEILFGIESPNPTALRRVGKEGNMDHARHVIQYARKVGIRTRVNFILGIPGDTPAVVDQIESFVHEAKPDTVHCCMLAVYPGTPMYENPEEFGIINFSTNYTADKQFTPMVDSEGFNSRDQQEAFIRLAHLLSDPIDFSSPDSFPTNNLETKMKSYYKPDDIEAVEYKDHLVLIDQVTGKIAKLDSLSSLIWLMSDGSMSCNEVTEQIMLDDLLTTQVEEISANLADHHFLALIGEEQ